MDEIYRFPIMIAASVVVMVFIISIVVSKDNKRANFQSIFWISVIVSAGGMLFAKYGANLGLSWKIYYTVPAMITIFLPPVYFGMSIRQAVTYIFLASLSAPAMHYAFSYFLGWNQYMPFLGGI